MGPGIHTPLARGTQERHKTGVTHARDQMVGLGTEQQRQEGGRQIREVLRVPRMVPRAIIKFLKMMLRGIKRFLEMVARSKLVEETEDRAGIEEAANRAAEETRMVDTEEMENGIKVSEIRDIKDIQEENPKWRIRCNPQNIQDDNLARQVSKVSLPSHLPAKNNANHRAPKYKAEKGRAS